MNNATPITNNAISLQRQQLQEAKKCRVQAKQLDGAITDAVVVELHQAKLDNGGRLPHKAIASAIQDLEGKGVFVDNNAILYSLRVYDNKLKRKEATIQAPINNFACNKIPLQKTSLTLEEIILDPTTQDKTVSSAGMMGPEEHATLNGVMV